MFTRPCNARAGLSFLCLATTSTFLLACATHFLPLERDRCRHGYGPPAPIPDRILRQKCLAGHSISLHRDLPRSFFGPRCRTVILVFSGLFRSFDLSTLSAENRTFLDYTFTTLRSLRRTIVLCTGPESSRWESQCNPPFNCVVPAEA